VGQEESTLAGCSKRLFSKAAAREEARRTLRYIEPLIEARTKLADFFSILLIAPTDLLIEPTVKETAWKHGDAYSPTAS
jgi:hypothetical protein